jgi:hypothetical protein
VAPILQTFIFTQGPTEVLDWADKVAKWYFHRIIPCHFDAPIEVGPHQFRQAFTFLEKRPSVGEDLLESGSQPLPEEDFKFMRELEENLTKRGITSPAKE